MSYITARRLVVTMSVAGVFLLGMTVGTVNLGSGSVDQTAAMPTAVPLASAPASDSSREESFGGYVPKSRCYTLGAGDRVDRVIVKLVKAIEPLMSDRAAHALMQSKLLGEAKARVPLADLDRPMPGGVTLCVIVQLSTSEENYVAWTVEFQGEQVVTRANS